MKNLKYKKYKIGELVIIIIIFEWNKWRVLNEETIYFEEIQE